MSISDLIVVMKSGVIQQIGKPQEVYNKPVNLFVAKFLGTPAINVFEGKMEGGKLLIGGAAVLDRPDVPDQDVYVGIRPEGFVVDENGPFELDLRQVEVMGRDTSVVADHPASLSGTTRAIVSTDDAEHVGGEKVRFSLKKAKVHLFHKETEALIEG